MLSAGLGSFEPSELTVTWVASVGVPLTSTPLGLLPACERTTMRTGLLLPEGAILFWLRQVMVRSTSEQRQPSPGTILLITPPIGTS